MFSITMAFSNEPPESIKEREQRDRRLAISYMKNFSKTFNVDLFPRIRGHNSVILSTSEKEYGFSFAPKKLENTPIMEWRKNAQLLVPNFKKGSRFSRLLSPLFPTCEGEVHDPEKEYRLANVIVKDDRDAYLTVSVNEAKFNKALTYAEGMKLFPPTYRAIDSNCVLFTVDVAKRGGFDITRFAGQHNVLIPDGILAAFMNMTNILDQTGQNVWEGKIDDSMVKVGFNDKDLIYKIEHELKIKRPKSICLSKPTAVASKIYL